MDVGRFTSSLRKMCILHSIQELAMARMSNHVTLVSGITNSSVEVVSWSNGCMDLLDFKNSSKGLGGDDVDLNMPHGFGAFIRHLSPVILQLLLISQFLQHLGDLAGITSVMLELVNISVRKMNLDELASPSRSIFGAIGVRTIAHADGNQSLCVPSRKDWNGYENYEIG
jgi:hypothetical protein